MRQTKGLGLVFVSPEFSLTPPGCRQCCIRPAKLEQHLWLALVVEQIPYLFAVPRRFQWLRLQAREDPSGRGPQQQPVEGLPGTQPVIGGVRGRDKDGCRERRLADAVAGRHLAVGLVADASRSAEPALPEASRLPVAGSCRARGHAVPGLAVIWSEPTTSLGSDLCAGVLVGRRRV